MIGRTLGHYRITEEIGKGGMGVVYRATDTKLNRDVALKILPEQFANDPERMARFEREAQVLASLNHPNIAAIHGVEEDGGVRCLVLELVEGPTLADRLKSGSFPIEEALDIARQMAEGIEAAHEKGIIHRDLKPANVKVKDDGTVKVLDFGLAKALEPPKGETTLDHSPTVSQAATRAGTLLGTVAYMSPEQARAKPTDRRADIWAFGVVLFEMLAGQRPFRGGTVSDIITSILSREPDWAELPAKTPPLVRRVLRRCLEKKAKDRLHHIADARIEVEDSTGEIGVEAAAAGVPEDRRTTLWKRLLPWAAGIVLALVAGTAVWYLRPAAPEPAVRKFALAVEDLQADAAHPLVISPEGEEIVYASGGRLWIRALDQLEPRELPNTENASKPFWSPDSSWLVFSVEKKLWKIPAGGGERVPIADLPTAGGAEGAWLPDGRIIYTTGSTGLRIVSSQGGISAELLAPGPDESDFHDTSVLPDGRGALFVVHRGPDATDTIAVFDGTDRKNIFQIDGGEVRDPAYSPTGHILYWRWGSNDGLWALPFSLSRLEVTGDPFLVDGRGETPSVSTDGTLVYFQGEGAGGTAQLVWVNRKGEVEEKVGEPLPLHPFFDLSPDGRKVAIGVGNRVEGDIWVLDLERGTRARLTSAVGRETATSWSPDGAYIYYTHSDDEGIAHVMRKAADGTGEAETMAKGQLPFVSPDGKYIFYLIVGADTGADLAFFPLEGDGKPVKFLDSDANELWGQVSPNGRYVAYTSNASGKYEVYIQHFPSGDGKPAIEGKWLVSVNGGMRSCWSRDGGKLYYRESDALMEVDVTTGDTLQLGIPRRLFSRRGVDEVSYGNFFPVYAVSPDEQRFLMIQRPENEATRSITVVQNWFAEFHEENE